MANSEIDALTKIEEALRDLEEEGRVRVLQWAISKFAPILSSAAVPRRAATTPPTLTTQVAVGSGELPGIARLSESGNFQLTVRDLKAKNTNDAAIRLVHVTVAANEKLTGETSVSSKKVIVPILRQWRAYTGNTRKMIADHKGILRDGDMISLDAHAKRDAEEYMAQMVDDTIQGSWRPQGSSRRKSKATARSSDQS